MARKTDLNEKIESNDTETNGWKKLALAVVFLVAALLPCLCHAEEQLFLDDNPRYPLVFAVNPHCHYLDLDSCLVVSGDKDSFEIYAEGIYKSTDVAVQHDNPIYRFRKNEESDWKLQGWSEQSQEWYTFPDLQDQEATMQALDETGDVDYHFPTYFIFKRVYQHLFGEPYEDDIDDDVLRRSAIIPQNKETSRIRCYFWGDKNYPLVWICQEWAWYLDKNSVFVEMEEPTQYILRVLVLESTFLHYDDGLPRRIHSYRFLYDKDERKMYKWSPKMEEWHYLTPDENDHSLDNGTRYVGEAAFYLVYGERFYDVSPRWSHKRNPFFNNMEDKSFYERLDGEV